MYVTCYDAYVNVDGTIPTPNPTPSPSTATSPSSPTSPGSPTIPTSPTSPTSSPNAVTPNPTPVPSPTSGVKITRVNTANFQYMRLKIDDIATGWTVTGVKVRGFGDNTAWVNCQTPNLIWGCDAPENEGTWTLPYDIQVTATNSQSSETIPIEEDNNIITSIEKNDVFYLGVNFDAAQTIVETGNSNNGGNGLDVIMMISIIGGSSLVLIICLAVIIGIYCKKRKNQNAESNSNDIVNVSNQNNGRQFNISGINTTMANEFACQDGKITDAMSPNATITATNIQAIDDSNSDDDDDDDNDNNNNNNNNSGIIYDNANQDQNQTDNNTNIADPNIRLEESVTIGFGTTNTTNTITTADAK